MITHQEAEILTSARQDAPLDSVVERELQAHLATCDQCRSFAAATERLTAGIRTLPGIAANPRMKRDVMDRVRAGRGPFAGLLGGFGNGFQPGPAIAAIALVAVIGMFGWLALDRLLFDEGGDGNNQIAAIPTAEITREVAEPTETSQPTVALAAEAPTLAAPTATTAAPPTEMPSLTQPAAPTATTAPVPTDTPAPTEPPAPTATTAPEPTATTAPAPTETTAPEPTATTAPEPTDEPTSEGAALNLTRQAESTATAAPTPEPTAEPTPTAVPPTPTPEPTATEVPPTPVPTIEPTATDVPPTATVEPTVEPTATGVPPTATLEPTIEPTATDVPPTATVMPTATESPSPEPTPTPAIEPMDGATSEPAGAGDSGSILGTGSADDDAEIPVAPDNSDGGEEASEVTIDATESPTGDVSDTGGDAAVIEPIDPNGQENQDPAVESTSEPATEMTEGAASAPSTQSLVDVSERYSGIAGDPGGDLGLTGDGRLEYVSVPDAASMTTPEGLRLQMADVQPGVVQVCGDGFCEPGTDTPESEGWQGDVPLGVVDNTVYVLRLYAERSEVYALQPQGTRLVEGTLIAELGLASAPGTVYESGGSLYAWLPTSQWLVVSGNSAQLLSGGYTNPANVRFAPSAEGGPLIGYFSGGSLVIASVNAPDAAILTLPADGVDFDISPPGDRVALIRGNDIVIYDMQGNELGVYAGGDSQPGSVIWLRSGIIWVDRATGALYQIPETAP